jgi:CDP-2,3-bis-(O-geranylgeranyl)-sn-glycerol synthase
MGAFGLSLQLLLLLAVANGAPIVAKKWLGKRWNTPLDGGLHWFDGRALLGTSKTVRGMVAAVLCTALAAVVLGWPWAMGASVGALAMLGDALSSFIKRRMAIAPSGKATGLDQIPEALLPLLVLKTALGLTWWQTLGITLAFFVLEMPLAILFFRLGWRDRPY